MQNFGYNAIGPEQAIRFSDITLPGLQDYKSNTISDNANYIQTTIGAGTFVYVPGIGRELQNNNYGLEPKLMLKGVQASNGIYTVVYKINNTVKADFTVYARYTGAGSLLNIPIKITTNKVEILEWHEYTASAYIDLDGANEKTYVEIKTQFNEAAGSLNVYYDGTLILTKTGYTGTGNDYYAGIMAKQNGFIVESINAGSINLSTSSDILSQASQFLEILALIIVWNVNPVFLPLELNIIFIKTQVIGLIVCVAVWLRG
jgi:hypothetical protein